MEGQVPARQAAGRSGWHPEILLVAGQSWNICSCILLHFLYYTSNHPLWDWFKLLLEISCPNAPWLLIFFGGFIVCLRSPCKLIIILRITSGPVHTKKTMSASFQKLVSLNKAVMSFQRIRTLFIFDHIIFWRMIRALTRALFGHAPFTQDRPWASVSKIISLLGLTHTKLKQDQEQER